MVVLNNLFCKHFSSVVCPVDFISFESLCSLKWKSEDQTRAIQIKLHGYLVKVFEDINKMLTLKLQFIIQIFF